MNEPALQPVPAARSAGSACLVALALLFSAPACEDPERREPLPDWRVGYPDASTDVGPLADAFAFTFSERLQYSARLGRRDALEQPCAIQADEAPMMLECIVDANELDLWTLGFAYDIHVPQGMCDFVLHVPYMFANFEIGEGPARVAYTVNRDGTFSDQVNAMNGRPHCPYDHKAGDELAPNCCLGQYTLEVTSTETGRVSTSQESWGGKRGDCYYGAAYVEEGAQFNAEGVPMPRFIHTRRREHHENIRFAGVSDKFPANIAHANYFDAADHDGGAPAGLRAIGARPYYEAYCLDDAEEIIAHLRMSVREWNEEREYDGSGDPDSMGTEQAFVEGPIDLDDLPDWRTITPGADDYPNVLFAR